MERLAGFLTEPARWATVLYRLSHWLLQRRRGFLARVVYAVSKVVSGVEIHPTVKIGPRFRINHGVGLVIGSNVEIGSDCIALHGVTIGGRTGSYGMPRIGNRVVVGANAMILGPITIGDDAKIGAGAVVLCDVPAGCTAVGNPARVLPPKGERAASSGLQ